MTTTLATNLVASLFRRITSGGKRTMSYRDWQAHQDANNEALRQAAEERQLEAERRAQEEQTAEAERQAIAERQEAERRAADERNFRTERFW